MFPARLLKHLSTTDVSGTLILAQRMFPERLIRHLSTTDVPGTLILAKRMFPERLIKHLSATDVPECLLKHNGCSRNAYFSTTDVSGTLN